MIEVLQIKPELKWIHIMSPSDEDLQYLADTYKFHPLDLEDCRSKKQRPKIDVYDDYNFIILHYPYFDKMNKFLITKEVKFFWGKDYLISIGKSHWLVRKLFYEAKENEELRNELLSGTSDMLLYKILDRLIMETFSIANQIGEEVELLNRDLFSKKAERTIERISVCRKNLILLNTILRPQLRVFGMFESGEIKGYAENMEEYWSNILDYYRKLWDMIEDYEQLIEGLSKTFDSLMTNRTNETMKVLTLFSSIMLPLTFITGIYGMNIALPFQEHPYSFLIVVLFMVFVAIGLLIFFKKRRLM